MVLETRSQKEHKEKPDKSLKVMESISKVTYEDFCTDQKEAESFKFLWEKAEDKGDLKYVFEIQNRLLWRRLWELCNNDDYCKVLVIPQRYREIMKIAHESLLSGPLGISNTLFKIQNQFYWPCIYCRQR